MTPEEELEAKREANIKKKEEERKAKVDAIKAKKAESAAKRVRRCAALLSPGRAIRSPCTLARSQADVNQQMLEKKKQEEEERQKREALRAPRLPRGLALLPPPADRRAPSCLRRGEARAENKRQGGASGRECQKRAQAEEHRGCQVRRSHPSLRTRDGGRDGIGPRGVKATTWPLGRRAPVVDDDNARLLTRSRCPQTLCSPCRAQVLSGGRQKPQEGV